MEKRFLLLCNHAAQKRWFNGQLKQVFWYFVCEWF
jgi:hypothetical protein